jgi:hypothetical protein
MKTNNNFFTPGELYKIKPEYKRILMFLNPAGNIFLDDKTWVEEDHVLIYINQSIGSLQHRFFNTANGKVIYSLSYPRNRYRDNFACLTLIDSEKVRRRASL